MPDSTEMKKFTENIASFKNFLNLMLLQEKAEDQDCQSEYTPDWSDLDMFGGFKIILKRLNWH